MMSALTINQGRVKLACFSHQFKKNIYTGIGKFDIVDVQIKFFDSPFF